MTGASDEPVVFAGPTISSADVRKVVPSARVLPPVRRGDLYELRNAGAHTFLVIDGSFSHGFAISPGEIVDVLRDGARVYGCSSMGAIRAAECWPAGMVGIGTVYRLYRLDILTSDDEVAVATDPDRDHAALSHALVNVRYALKRAVARRAISPADEQQVLRQVMALNFTQRSARRMLDGVAAPLRDELSGWLESVDVKRNDAHRALRVLNAPLPGTRHGTGDLGPRSRYGGHDPLFGCAAEGVRLELVQWLFGSGRYQRYIWPLAFGDPMTGPAGKCAPEERRMLLADMIAHAVEQPELLAEMMLAELEYVEEASSELVMCHAVNELSRLPVAHVPPSISRAVREETALRHGAPNWATLTSHVTDGALFNALPFDWVTTACDKLARARTAARDPRLLAAMTTAGER